MPISKQRSLVPFVRCSMLVLLFAGATLSTTAYAQQANKPAADAKGDSTEKAAEEQIRQTLDLGLFEVKDLRPTRNETAKLTFKLHLAFAKQYTENQVAQLESWQHRLRDQVIIAIRLAQVKDFQEPDLARFRRLILIRVNRLLRAKLVEEALLTEYLFRTH